MNRKLALTLISSALLFVGIVTFVAKRAAQTNGAVDPRYAKSEYPVVVPQLCQTLEYLKDGNPTRAYNMFYQGAHTTLHALGTDVDSRKDGRSLGGRFLRAKSRVEADLITKPPRLVADLNALIDLSGEALRFVKADITFNAPTKCE